MAETPQPLTAGSTNVIELSRLKDRITKLVIDDATVTVSLYDDAGVLVLDAEDLPMPHVDTTAGGHYRGTLSHELDLTVGDTYEARITATAMDGSVRLFNVPCPVVKG